MTIEVIWRPHRKRPLLQSVPFYQITPNAVTTGYWPAFKPPPSFRIKATFKFQDLPIPPMADALVRDTSNYPNIDKPFDVRYRKHWIAQTTQPLLYFPATPVVFQGIPQPIKEFRRKNKSWKIQTAIILGDYETIRHLSMPIHSENYRKTTNRRFLRGPDLASFPQTSAGYIYGFFPGSAAVKENHFSFEIRRQNIKELSKFTPQTFTADVTAFTKPTTNYSRFDIKLQKTPEHDYYNTPTVIFPVTAWVLKFNPTKRTKFINQKALELNSYPFTATVTNTEPVVAWQIKMDRQFGFDVRGQNIEVLNQYTAAPTFTDIGLEYTMNDNRLHYTLNYDRLEYTIK